jgi:hypothetical protein
LSNVPTFSRRDSYLRSEKQKRPFKTSRSMFAIGGSLL